MARSEAIAGYQSAAPELIERYEALSAEEVLEPVLPFFPSRAGRVLDVGAGTGRNAAWFAGQGHSVVACEPVEAFRKYGSARYSDHIIQWVDDALPGLDSITAAGFSFDLVLLSAVWQHVAPGDRRPAMACLGSLLGAGGSLVMSVRHGPGAAGRPVFESDDEETVSMARANGLAVVSLTQTESIQARNKAAGVTWSWMVFGA